MDSTVIGIWVAAALTLIVLSYVLSDNPLYKLAEHIFVGTSVGWTFVLIYQNVLLGNLFYKLKDAPGENLPLLIPLLLGVLLLLRPIKPLAWLSNTSLAIVVGAGAALAIVGASAGLLAPQALATVLPVVPTQMTWEAWRGSLSNLSIVVGVVSVFLYFHFTGKRLGRFGRPIQLAGILGKYFMMMAFGALFASIAISRIALLVGRISFLLEVVRNGW
ncbi:MAG: hypothetical protein Q7O66_03065 [Dehalococcoidia bacterium]|nr:hypothetical protein [Dehalococcoidia bacterium]